MLQRGREEETDSRKGNVGHQPWREDKEEREKLDDAVTRVGTSGKPFSHDKANLGVGLGEGGRVSSRAASVPGGPGFLGGGVGVFSLLYISSGSTPAFRADPSF